jgi:hypothetical protein
MDGVIIFVHFFCSYGITRSGYTRVYLYMRWRTSGGKESSPTRGICGGIAVAYCYCEQQSKWSVVETGLLVPAWRAKRPTRMSNLN